MNQTIRVEIDIPTTTPRPDVLVYRVARTLGYHHPTALMAAQWTDSDGVHDEVSPISSWPEVK